MSEEEKKAIEDCKELVQELKQHKDKDFIGRLYYRNKPVEDILSVLLNLIEEQQKEIEELKAIKSMQDYRIQVIDEREFISKDKIRNDLKICQEVFEKEMKPYQTEYGLDVTYLSKKEKAELINKRNCLLTQMKTYEMLLEEK